MIMQLNNNNSNKLQYLSETYLLVFHFPFVVMLAADTDPHCKQIFGLEEK